jgi:cytochrome c-type biogenesis protein CcmH
MIFWLLASTLVALVVIFSLLPMLRGSDEGDALAFARAFYRDREAELKAQRDAGEIDQAAFEAALAEQGRRLLALARGAEAQAEDRGSAIRRRKLAALAMLVLVPVSGIGLYLKLGKPGMPDAPLASRQVAPRDFDVATAIQKIEQHLAKNPDDGRGFEVVAPVYMKAGRFADAAHAYRRVIALLGETPARHADLGESLVAVSNGIVSAEARQAFEAAVRGEAGMPKARYYLALALEQDGKIPEALKALDALLADLPESPARSRVAAEISRIKGEPAKDAEAPADKGTAEALAAMPEKDRNAAIAGMVDGLEQRLFGSGGSAEEWARLVRARLVLGQKDKAAAALEKARLALKDQPGGASALETLNRAINQAP